MEKIYNLAKRRGFVFPSAEIYGGLNGFWDYGPLGVALKNNIKKSWWQRNVMERSDVVGMEGAIITNPKVWEASGHAEHFQDQMAECRNCHHRFRAEEVKEKCPFCGQKDWTAPHGFNTMFRTHVGHWLRGRSAPGRASGSTNGYPKGKKFMLPGVWPLPVLDTSYRHVTG